MRISKKMFGLVAVLLLGGFLICPVLFQDRNPEKKLGDGTVLRLERISYSRNDSFEPQGLIQRLKALLPKGLTRHIFKSGAYSGSSRWWSGELNDTNKYALYFWFTRRDDSLKGFADVKLGYAQILDEHGCGFTAATGGGLSDGTILSNGYPVGFFAFQAFPRHQKHFRLKVYDDSYRFLTEFTLPNPAPVDKTVPELKPDPLPITKVDNGVTFILKDIQIKAGAENPKSDQFGFDSLSKIKTTFEIREGGEITKAWHLLDADWQDSSGNLASKWWPEFIFLCPQESAWKLKAKFFGSNESGYASNQTWTVKGLKVPAPGESVAMVATQKVQGATVEAIALTGAGSVVYSNNIPMKSSPPTDSKGGYSYGSETGSSYRTFKVQGPSLHIAVSVPNISADQRLSVVATDDQGRKFYAEEQQWGGGRKLNAKKIHYFSRTSNQPFFLPLDLPKDSKSVDITFSIHQARVVEFILQPPRSQSAEGQQGVKVRQ